MKIILPLVFLLAFFSAAAQTVQISGRVYYDANGNHVFDGGDVALANRSVIPNNDRFYAKSTDDMGLYTLSIPVGSYDISVDGAIDNDSYIDLGRQHRVYTDAGTDVLDFAYQKRDSVESILAEIGFENFTIPQSGGIFQYTLSYGYNGSLQQMPLTIALNFNPKLIITSSPAPSVTSSGKLQWNFAGVQHGETGNGSIQLTIKYPAVGDTILSFTISPQFIPGIAVTLPSSEYSNTNYQVHDLVAYIDLAAEKPIGKTSGVKWLRHIGHTTDPNLYYSNYEGLSIDTTQYNIGYFVAAHTGHINDMDSWNNKPYIAKLNTDGLTVWEKYVDSIGGQRLFTSVTRVKHTPDGGCILLGSYDNGANFETYVDAILIAKFDSLGNITWIKKLKGSNDEERANDVAVLADGSSIITGWAGSNGGDFLSNNADTSSFNAFITKLSPTGRVIFTKIYGGSGDDLGGWILPLQNGGFIVSALTESNDGDVKGAHVHSLYESEYNPPYPYDEAWILNIDANGNIIWSKCFGGTKQSYFSGLAENNGGILLTGGTNSKDGDLPYYPEGSVPFWALQISAANGSILWSKLHKQYKGYVDTNYVQSPIIDMGYNEIKTGLHKTKDGNFVLGGTFTDKYGEIKSKHGAPDLTLLKINNTGDIIWQKAIGGTGEDELNDIQIDKNDDIVFIGNTYSGDDDLYQQAQSNQLMVIGKLGITNIIKGQVFIDNNNNHIHDAGERFYSQGRINSAKYADTITARIFDGNFLNNEDTGTYITIYQPANNYYTIFPAMHTSSFNTFDLKDSFDIALSPKPNVNDLEVELLPLSTARPGFDATYRIITKNVGTTNITNAVIGFKKDARQIYQTASRPYSGILADSIWWGPFNLNAFAIDTLYVTVTLATPPTLNNGDTLSVTASANPVLNDSSAANNIFTLHENVRGSFDPNDKTEVHAGTLTTTQYAGGDHLQYQIRFQNTGTDTAFFITVKDTLQAGMDFKSLEVISASHPYTFRLNGNVATWDFKNIKLPDSVTNEAGSHGFISFKIKPKTGLAVGEEFSNKAAIYFDYNLPVLTNQEKTVIGNKAGNCPGSNVTFTAGIPGSSYQWQINTGTGFTNVANTGIYSGATTAVLKLTAPPTTMNGYRYRCVVNGNTNSPENKLHFTARWKGTTSTAWENAANWDCGTVPNAQTEVIIPQAAVYPLVSSNVSCYSLRLSPGSIVTVTTGFKLTISGVAN